MSIIAHVSVVVDQGTERETSEGNLEYEDWLVQRYQCQILIHF